MILDNGRIVEIGSHEELVALGGIYDRIYETQFEALAESVSVPSSGGA
jgi:ATP-binding cassette subfamily B protein